MANTFLTTSLIAKEALFRLNDSLIVPKMAKRDYEKYFANKIGDTISVKDPYYVESTSGRAVGSNDTSDMVDTKQTMTVDKWRKVVFKANAEEMALKIEDFGERYLKSGTEELAHYYDEMGVLALVTGAAYNMGEPGDAMDTDDAHTVRAICTELSFPENMRNWSILNPFDYQNISKDIRDVNHPGLVGQNIQHQYKGMLADFSVFSMNKIPLQKVIRVKGTPLVKDGSQTGGTLNTDGWTASVPIFAAGTQFQIAGVNWCRRRGDRDDTGLPATFTVTADTSSDGSGEASLSITPEIVTTGADRNVFSGPADNAAITIIGADSGNNAVDRKYRQNIFWEENALQYANVIIPKMDSTTFEAVYSDEDTGVSINVLKWFDGTDRSEKTRADVFFGVKCLRPDLALRQYTTYVT